MLKLGKTPVFKHDCTKCVFLGHYNGADLYYHPIGLETVIARFSDNPGDYNSGLGSKFPEQLEMANRIVQITKSAKKVFEDSQPDTKVIKIDSGYVLEYRDQTAPGVIDVLHRMTFFLRPVLPLFLLPARSMRKMERLRIRCKGCGKTQRSFQCDKDRIAYI